jgi:KDO2-lipid IV(A) lauroyltransferase
MGIVHFLFRIIVATLSRMPFWLLHLKAEGLRLLLYYVIGYRKKVVFANLRNSFPEKSEKEIRKIAWHYYRNISDLIMEVIKINGISEKQIRERMTLKNFEVVEKYILEGRSFIASTGHIGNWEWLGVRLSLDTRFTTFAVVKPLTDPFFDKWIISMRMKFQQTGKIDYRNVLKEMIRHKNSVNMTIIAGDQTPTASEINYWTPFLNQETAVFLGTEKIAKILDIPVIFFDTQRIKRGHYQMEFKLITDKPKETAEFEITEAHVRLLEDAIKRNPDNWLWSHRRWKHKRVE